MEKPEYIKQLEKEVGVFSIMRFPIIEGDFLKYLKSKKIDEVYQECNYQEGNKFIFNNIIFETKQKFYLSIENIDVPTKWGMTIYYKPKQYSELYLFITQLNKEYKNATTNNRTN